jgi:hypothetical protein
MNIRRWTLIPQLSPQAKLGSALGRERTCVDSSLLGSKIKAVFQLERNHLAGSTSARFGSGDGHLGGGSLAKRERVETVLNSSRCLRGAAGVLLMTVVVVVIPRTSIWKPSPSPSATLTRYSASGTERHSVGLRHEIFELNEAIYENESPSCLKFLEVCIPQNNTLKNSGSLDRFVRRNYQTFCIFIRHRAFARIVYLRSELFVLRHENYLGMEVSYPRGSISKITNLESDNYRLVGSSAFQFPLSSLQLRKISSHQCIGAFFRRVSGLPIGAQREDENDEGGPGENSYRGLKRYRPLFVQFFHSIVALFLSGFLFTGSGVAVLCDSIIRHRGARVSGFAIALCLLGIICGWFLYGCGLSVVSQSCPWFWLGGAAACGA